MDEIEEMLKEEDTYYYTPKIEDFCVGFRYYLDNRGHWDYNVFDLDDLDDFDWKSLSPEYMELFRVKYLDSDDIEEQGFVMNKGNNNLFESNELTIHFHNVESMVQGEWVYQGEGRIRILKDDETVFYGSLKNINELQDQLKRI